MYIQVTQGQEPNLRVKSVNVTIGTGFLRVVINTQGSWQQYFRQGGSSRMTMTPPPGHQSILIGDQIDDHTDVLLIANDLEEAKMLHWNSYSSQDDDYIEFLFLSPPNEEQEVLNWTCQ